MGLFKPYQFLSTVDKVDLEQLAAEGFDCILLDMDNTVLPRDTEVVPDAIIEWIARAKEMGFKLSFVSNNWHGYVFDRADKLGLPIVHKAMKPFPLAYHIAKRRLGCKRRNTVSIGDQLMTDVFGSRLAGIKPILVLPQATKDLPHTLFLRKIERLILKDAKPTR